MTDVRNRAALAAALALALTAAAPAAGPRAEWLKQHATPVRTIDPDDEDFSDLLPLAEKIGTARVVALGEQSHGDGAAFLAKHRLVRFLHQKMGFDVLAWESGLFDCARADAALCAGDDPAAAAEKGVFPIWTASRHVLPVFTYAAATARTGRRLETAGFDCQFSTRESEQHFLTTVREFCELAGPTFLPAADAERMAWLVRQVAEEKPGGTAEEVAAARKAVTDLIARIHAGGDALDRAHGKRRIQFVRRVLVNLLTFDDVRRKTDPSGNLRDKAMGENVVWLANEYYAGRKVILWAASYHLMRNSPSVKWLEGFGGYAKTVTAGDPAHKALGKDYYAVMFVAGGGRAGNPFHGPHDLDAAPAGSLDELFAKAGRDYAFVDFRRPPAGGEWLREPQVARPLGYSPMRADWGDVFDGVFFTKTMFPSTADGKVPDGVLTAKRAGGDAVGQAIEAFRRTVVGYDLAMHMNARKPPPPYNPRRLEDYPTPQAWPPQLCETARDPSAFVRVPRGKPVKTADGGVALDGPLAERVASSGYTTALLLGGVAQGGALNAESYANVYCRGEMAGRVVFGSYATALIDGDLTGSVVGTSYLNLVVTGKFRGRLRTESASVVYLLGGLGGEIEGFPSRLYVGGRTTKAELERALGDGDPVYVHLEESDLPAGRHQVGRAVVTVGAAKR